MSESCSSSSTSSKIVNLREQLSSVAWVQCDITSCMKWRKVEKAVVDKLTSDTWWECSMNEDDRFNACNIPEEDIQSFDRLADRAKLVVFKSELTPGSLVWAKTGGYSNWPALVTKDPANGEFWEGDEHKPERGHYHVEFLGKCHCHLWVYAKSVELFGEGNVTLASQNNDTISKGQKNRRKRKRTKAVCHQMTKREKCNYNGGTVEIAIKEAMKLLPLTHEQRLRACRFVENIVKSENMDMIIEHNKTSKPVKNPSKNNKHRKNKRRCLDKSSNECGSTESDTDDMNSWFSPGKNNDLSFDFLTSLIDVSKEERFFLDISIYKEKERYFRENLGNFCSQFGLSEQSSFLVWDDTKVNFFDLFLAVDDRGGFEEVSRHRQWSIVYFDLTNYPSKGGAKKAKSVYKRYLYPYELYIKDKNPSSAIKYVKNCSKTSRQTLKKKEQSRGKCISETGGSDLDNAEFKQALDELDELLQSLQEKDGVVPQLYGNATSPQHVYDKEIQDAWDMVRSPEKHAHFDPTTGSQPTVAAEPEESAQVVPEMDFPSISEDSTPSGDDMGHGIEEDRDLLPLQLDNEEDWVLQELQALEHGI